MTTGIQPFRTVLVGLESPEGASGAVALAHRLAAGGATLRWVAAVYDPFADVVATRAGVDLESLHARLVERRRSTLLESVGDVAPGTMPPAALEVRVGRAEHVLAEAARRFGADLVVLSGGRNGDGRGTDVARHLLRSEGLPVVLSGPPAHDVARVVAAVDLSFAAEPTLRFARILATHLEVELEVVHVSAPVALPAEWTGTPTATEALLEAEDRAAATMLEGLLPAAVRRRTLRGAVLDTLRELGRTSPSMLLVVGAQGRGWVHRRILGSTTDALLGRCTAALAVVPVERPGAGPRGGPARTGAP